MTVEFVRSPIDQAAIHWHPDGSATVICPGCPNEPGGKPPFIREFTAADRDMAEATYRGHRPLDGEP